MSLMVLNRFQIMHCGEMIGQVPRALGTMFLEEQKSMDQWRQCKDSKIQKNLTWATTFVVPNFLFFYIERAVRPGTTGWRCLKLVLRDFQSPMACHQRVTGQSLVLNVFC